MTQRIPKEVARTIDYTDVRKDMTYGDVERICFEARGQQVGAVVVPSALVHRAAACLAGTDIAVSCYVGYPFGTQAAMVKTREAGLSLMIAKLEVRLTFEKSRTSGWTRKVPSTSLLGSPLGSASGMQTPASPSKVAQAWVSGQPPASCVVQRMRQTWR